MLGSAMISKHLNNMKLKDKLVLIIIVVATVISAFMAISFQYTIREYNKLLYAQTANSLSFFSDELMYQFDSIETAASYITFDSSFQTALEEFNQLSFSSLAGQKAKKEITDVLNRYYTYNMVHISVIPENGQTLWWGKSILDEPEEIMNTLYKRCDSKNGAVIWIPSSKSNEILCARRILKVENLSLKPMGYLVIQLDLKDITDSLLSSRYANGQQFELFITGDEQVIYPADYDNLNNYYPVLSSQKNYSIEKIRNNRMFITFSKLPLTGSDWHISLAIPYDNIFYSLRRLVPIFIVSLLIALFISTAIAGRIVKNISYQFNTLVKKMKLVKMEGVMQTVPSPTNSGESQDEFTLLNSYFDQMVVELKGLIEENYIKQLLITQAELKALEQQVNPHFLYNTLNSINWLAKKSDTKSISVIVESLGVMLHSTLSNGKMIIPLEKELDIVSSYIKIQQIRFEDLRFETDIDTSLFDIGIPKMIIQPLIENAIIHSQEEPQEQYIIQLSIRQTTGCIRIQVENSGSRIDVNILEHLKNETVKPKGNGIGLMNIDARLRLIYGEEYHLHFDNKNDMAIVWFEIPLSKNPE